MIFYLPPWFTITLELITLNFISSVNSRNVFQLWDGPEDAGVVNIFLVLLCLLEAFWSGLTLAGFQAPSKATLSLPSAAGQKRENITEDSRLETRTGRDHPPGTVTGRTGSN